MLSERKPQVLAQLEQLKSLTQLDEGAREKFLLRTIYDPTAGTGAFLSAGMEYVHELNPKALIRAFGQELNAENYAICKGDMLIKGQNVSRIKLGNTLASVVTKY